MHAQLRINHRLNDIDSWLSAPLVVEASPHRIFAPGMPIRPNGSYRPRLDCGRVGAGCGRDRDVQTAISRIWRAFGLQPHLVDTWKLSTDPLFIDKVRNVVGVAPRSARQGDGAVRRRGIADAGARPHRTHAVVNRLCAVGTQTPNDGGRYLQAQPLVST